MILSLALLAVCALIVAVVFRFGPAVVARQDERLAGWDDRLFPDSVRFPSPTAAAGASVGDSPRRPGASAGGVEVRTPAP